MIRFAPPKHRTILRPTSWLRLGLPFLLVLAAVGKSTEIDRPNVVIIFCDDLGYGDLGCFGHPTIRTPNLDRMASEGARLTQFYVSSCVCTPSRAGLMTGRLPQRTGMCSNKRRVLFPDSLGGLPPEEVTIAELLKQRDYATACIGKWHLGHLPQYLPTSNGFDEYFGIPYSNDMDRVAGVGPKGREAFWNPKSEYWAPPLMEGTRIIERPTDQSLLTKRYTERAVKFIREHKSEPFFVYLAHSMPHVPLFRSEAFRDHSLRGRYGDVIEEIDWSVGQVLDTLRSEGLAERTLVFFTSDNGPWLIFDTHGGSAGLLRGGKGSTWEGGMREPAIAWWPGTIPPRQVIPDLTSSLDLFATVASLTKCKMPSDRIYDSYDMSKLLKGVGKSERDAFYYYRGYQLMAARVGPWKAHFMTQAGYGDPKPQTHRPPALYQLEHDPSEKYDIHERHPDVIQRIEEAVAQHRAQMKFAPSQLERRKPPTRKQKKNHP